MKFRKMLCGTLGLLAIVSLAACGGGDSKSESKADSAKDLAKRSTGRKRRALKCMCHKGKIRII